MHEEALQMAIRLGSKKAEGFAYVNLGCTHLSLGAYDKSKFYLIKALEFSRQHQTKFLEIVCLQRLLTYAKIINDNELLIECEAKIFELDESQKIQPQYYVYEKQMQKEN